LHTLHYVVSTSLIFTYLQPLEINLEYEKSDLVITGLRLSGKEMAAHPVMMDMDLAGNTRNFFIVTPSIR
jgi:hypothetical protein